MTMENEQVTCGQCRYARPYIGWFVQCGLKESKHYLRIVSTRQWCEIGVKIDITTKERR